MGHVWLARDERSGLDVALKIVAREGKSGHRAEREARAASSLRHPRCQRILSLARDPSHVYIAYEYVPGRTLREALRAGELDDRAAIEVCIQISEALAHAHGRGIVHRDVKPSNVLLAVAPEIDVRLLDFGLAQMAEFDTLTALGDIPGTLAYISPERLQGMPATAAASGWAAAALPFYPAGWPLGLAAAGAGLGFLAPRAGLLFALAVAFFPLANVSLGLGIVYAALAAGWAALNWRDARTGLLLAVGPLAAPLAALPLLPLAAQLARGRGRRGVQVAAAVLLAAVVAGVRGVPLPFDRSLAPLGL